MQNHKRISSNSFEEKWSPAIAARGFASIPNCLIFCQSKLDIETAEFKTLAYLIACKFNNKNPWPSVRTIAGGAGSNVNTVRKHLRDLESKGLLKRVYRTGFTSEYSFAPLIHKLTNHECVNPLNKRRGVSQNVSRPPSQSFDTKEYKPRILNNNKPLSIGEIFQQRTRAP